LEEWIEEKEGKRKSTKQKSSWPSLRRIDSKDFFLFGAAGILFVARQP
jgi:hypothetical protein